MKDKLLKVIKSRKSIRTLAAALALTTALSGCNGFNNDKNNDLPEEPSVSYEQNVDDEHNHDHSHEEDDIIIETPIIDEPIKNEDPEDEEPIIEEPENPLEKYGITIDSDGHYVINGLVIPDLSNSSYKGVSIVDALYKEGYRYDWKYMCALAEHFKIENYRGTAEQNTYLLKCLRTWVLDLGLEQLKPITPVEPSNPGKPTDPGTTPTDPVDPTPGDPTPGEPPIKVEHKHEFGEWYSINDLLEEATCECGEKTYRTHNYQWTDWIPSEDGKKEVQTGTCLNCGHTFIQSRPLPTVEHKHEFGEWKVVKEPTCTEEGSKERVCLECSEVEVEAIPKLPHKYKGWSAWTNWSTPDKNGMQTRTRTKTCEDCGEVFVDTQTRTYTPPQPGHNHTWTGWSIAALPTCDTDGLRVNYCTSCGEKITQVLKALGHKFGLVQIKEPTCTEEGMEYQVCERCGKEIVRTTTEALGHSWDNGVITKEPTETTEGVKTFTCEVCHETKTERVPKLPHKNHNWGAWITIKEPTYDETGLKERTCSICGETERDIIPKKESPSHKHSYSWVVTKEPTCTEAGIETEKCSCGSTRGTRTYGAPLGHSYGSWTVTKEPTCTLEGEETRTCSACGKTEQRSVVALGHSWGEWSEWSEWSAPNDENIQTSTRTRTCSVCHEVETDTKTQTYIPDHTHVWGEGKVTIPATCTQKGLRTYICSCGTTRTEEIPMISHDYTYEVTTPSTCEVKGIGTYTCKECGHSYTVELSLADHNYVKDVSASKEPTCTDDGLDVETCSVCGDSHSENIPAKGHSYKVINISEGKKETKITYGCACGDTFTKTVSKEETPSIGDEYTDETNQQQNTNDSKLPIDGVQDGQETDNDKDIIPDGTPKPNDGDAALASGVDGQEEADKKPIGDAEEKKKEEENLGKDGEESDLPKGALGDVESEEDLKAAYQEFVETIIQQKDEDTKDQLQEESGRSLKLTPEA